MKLGADVWLPDSTWIDPDYCHLITIGDHCGFGGECMILAHDAQMDEFLDAGRIGRVVIHESCHIGARTVILPGVEIGPRTIVGANSTISRSLPPDSVCVGSPAKVVCTFDEYLARHRKRISESATFPYEKTAPSPELRERMVEATRNRDAYVVGGRSAELRGEGGTPRTPSN
jgi:maltose O-acetyltransferase